MCCPRRVLFVSGIEGAPFRYRVQLPAEALRLYNVESQFCYFTDPALGDQIEDANLVVLYRVPATERILHLIKSSQSKNIPVLYDLDDLIFDPEIVSEIPALQTLPSDSAKEWLREICCYRTTMQACDAFIGSTEPLCDYARRVVGIPATRFPNGVGLRLAQLSEAALEQPRTSGSLRIGYLSGTRTHDLDWMYIEPAVLAALEQFKDAELWLVGSVPLTAGLDRFAKQVKRLPMQAWQRLPEILCNLDVNLAPLTPGNYFNEAKSAIKWLEAALVCTPTIASPTQPFREAIQHDVNGLLAETPEAWEACLNDLLGDAAKRKRLGEQAQCDALQNYSPQLQGRRYIEALQWGMAQAGSEQSSRKTIHPVIEDAPVRSHPLEPYDMTLLVNRIALQTLTAKVRFGSPLEFDLPSGGADTLRLDLRFATYGGRGIPVKVSLQNAESGAVLGSSVAQASEINDDGWTAFHFAINSSVEKFKVKVERWQEQAPAESGRHGEIALWSEQRGSHQSGKRLRNGAPCVRLWVRGERHAVALPHDDTPPDLFSVLKARARLAYYVWQAKGAKIFITKAAKFIARQAKSFAPQSGA